MNNDHSQVRNIGSLIEASVPGLKLPAFVPLPKVPAESAVLSLLAKRSKPSGVKAAKGEKKDGTKRKRLVTEVKMKRT